MGSVNGFETLKLHSEFSRVYQKGKSAHAVSVALFYIPIKGEKKVGYTASKKVGNAVVRNRCKRRLRALFRDYLTKLPDGNYVFVAKKGLFDNNYNDIKRDFNYVLKKAGAIVGASGD